MKKLWYHIKYALFIVPAVIVALSYFGQVNIILAGIMVCLFLSLTQIIHLPEEMPGGPDNPDGTELHPKWIFFAAFVLLVVLLIMGWLFPSLWEYQAFGS